MGKKRKRLPKRSDEKTCALNAAKSKWVAFDYFKRGVMNAGQSQIIPKSGLPGENEMVVAFNDLGWGRISKHETLVSLFIRDYFGVGYTLNEAVYASRIIEWYKIDTTGISPLTHRDERALKAVKDRSLWSSFKYRVDYWLRNGVPAPVRRPKNLPAVEISD